MSSRSELTFQAVETILDKYGEIFVDEDDGSTHQAAEDPEDQAGEGEEPQPVTPEQQIASGYGGYGGQSGDSHSQSPSHSNDQHNDPRLVGHGPMS